MAATFKWFFFVVVLIKNLDNLVFVILFGDGKRIAR
jgi:hypothetical protein